MLKDVAEHFDISGNLDFCSNVTELWSIGGELPESSAPPTHDTRNKRHCLSLSCGIQKRPKIDVEGTLSASISSFRQNSNVLSTGELWFNGLNEYEQSCVMEGVVTVLHAGWMKAARRSHDTSAQVSSQ